MVIQPLIGNGYINPYYWVDDHPPLYGNNVSLDPSTYTPYTVGIYWADPLLRAPHRGLNSKGTIPRVPTFSLDCQYKVGPY